MSKTIWYVLAIVVLGTLVRLFVVFTSNVDYINNDAAFGYYPQAVTLANGGDYYYYFREPLTSYAQAAIAKAYMIIHGIRKLEVPVFQHAGDHALTHGVGSHHLRIILWIKFLNIVLQMGAIVLFWCAFKPYVDARVNWAFLSVTAIYLPLAIYCTFLLREQYLLFILSLLTFVWSRYYVTRRIVFLIPVAMLIAIATLTLQVYVLLLVVFAGYVLIMEKYRIIQTVQRCALLSLIFIIMMMPWLTKVYRYYPDLRIVKSMGCALTSDWMQCAQLSSRAGVDIYSSDMFMDDGQGAFRRSFDGTYDRESRRLLLIPGMHEKLSERIRNYKGCLINSVWFADYTSLAQTIAGKYSRIAIRGAVGFALVVTVAGLCGWYLSFVKILPMIPVAILQMSIFFILGSESRRQLPMLLFLLMCACIAGHAIVHKFSREKVPSLERTPT